MQEQVTTELLLHKDEDLGMNASQAICPWYKLQNT